MTRYFSVENDSLLLFGDTYAIRERIKESGGRWDSRLRIWRITQSPQSLQMLGTLGFSERAADLPMGGGVSTSPTLSKSVDAQSEIANQGSLTVAQVSHLVHLVMQQHFTQSLWVVGEISGLRRSGKHVYFDLADAESKDVNETGRMQRAVSLSCALWGDQYERITRKLKDFNLSDGLKVRARCSVDYRKDSGRIVLHIEDFDQEFSEGNIALNRQKVVAELKKRGLYDRNKQNRPTFFGFRIGLITADGSRALTDFVDELNRSALPFKVTLFDVHMQGTQTNTDVCKAFRLIAEREDKLDIVVLTRGGGSRLDLRWFDDIEICKQIAHCTLPVISAIGHFEDVSVADEVSFAAEKTPTGAARFLIERIESDKELLAQSYQAIGKLAAKRILKESQNLLKYKDRIGLLAKNFLNHEKTKISQLQTTLKILRGSIDKIIAKGFALVRTEDGVAIHPRDLDPAKQPKLLLDFRYKENNVFIKKRLVVEPITVEVKPEKDDQ